MMRRQGPLKKYLNLPISKDKRFIIFGSIAVFLLPLAIYVLVSRLNGQESPKSCIQVITYARNTLTGVCKQFPTPCDVPVDYTQDDSCEYGINS